jgi:hypothetical protein
MMFYVDVGIGIILSQLWFLACTSRLWHHYTHQSRNGLLMRGRLWCGHCARREINITRNQWREEFIEKLDRLDNE